MAKILVIDDDERVRSYLQRLFGKVGHEVVLAEAGQPGCDAARNPDIEVIVTDLEMAGELSDLDLVRALRRQRPDCPLVVASGYPTPERLAACEALGVVEFLTKPFELSFLASVLERLLAKQSAPRKS